MVNHKTMKVTEKYQEAERKANTYFHILTTQLKERRFATTLANDLKRYLRHSRLTNPFLNRDHVSTKHYQRYINYLDKKGTLDNYLDRSITYIYMRDLGRDIASKAMRKRIGAVAGDVKQYLKTNAHNEWFSLEKLYRIAQAESLESTFFWLLDKLKHVSSLIPQALDKVQSQRKLIKIIAGVLMHEIEELHENIGSEDRTKRLDHAVRIGYCYGLTYPFIDDLLDAPFLSDCEKKQYADLIRSTLRTGEVVPFPEWDSENKEVVIRIYEELAEAFEYLKRNQEEENLSRFYQHAYLFFHAQEQDRNKDLENGHYTNEELFIPIILKSSSSRMIVRSFRSFSSDNQIEERLFYYGIYNQLADDLTDLEQDLAAKSVTPYTYYVTYHEERPDLINPFALYWTVVTYLIHDVYQSDPKVRQVILDRAINSLKRLRLKLGERRYRSLMATLSLDSRHIEQVLQKVVNKTKDMSFFDKLLRDQMEETLQHNRQQKVTFRNAIETIRTEINQFLKIDQTEADDLLSHPLIDAANYSLKAGGKRLRPIMLWMMAKEGFQFEREAIIPLVKAIEYMHTASLIFDDLPTQDNATMRRGQKTVHEVYSSAVAELTGLFMTQKAIEEQTTLRKYDANAVLDLIAYSTKVTQELCKGQIIDLEAKGKRLTLEELNRLCFYKTGIGFEASLLMPAILAKADHQQIESIKKFAYHAGIAFQIKDDLLDVEGDTEVLGKTAGLDDQNNSATFVSLLGVDGAKKEMWNHYRDAIDSLHDLHVPTEFFEQLMSYIINRDY